MKILQLFSFTVNNSHMAGDQHMNNGGGPDNTIKPREPKQRANRPPPARKTEPKKEAMVNGTAVM